MNTRKKTALFGMTFGIILGSVLGISSNSAHAFGRKKPDPNVDSQAFPMRMVSIGKIYETSFKLPDGRTQVDMMQALPILITTQITDGSEKIKVIDGHGARYVINGGVTSFVAEVGKFGVTFGYKPGVGDIGSGDMTGASGKVDVRIGALEMDFHIIDTASNPPAVVVAKYASASDLGLNLVAQIDFKETTTAADFVFNSAMTPFFRRAVSKVIEKISTDPKTNFYMDWDSKISFVNLDLKRVIFEAGMRDSIVPGNVFTVYDGKARIGEIRVEKVDLQASSAYFKDDANGRLISQTRLGDGVKVYFKQAP